MIPDRTASSWETVVEAAKQYPESIQAIYIDHERREAFILIPRFEDPHWKIALTIGVLVGGLNYRLKTVASLGRPVGDVVPEAAKLVEELEK